jgi:hypothetical protein
MCHLNTIFSMIRHDTAIITVLFFDYECVLCHCCDYPKLEDACYNLGYVLILLSRMLIFIIFIFFTNLIFLTSLLTCLFSTSSKLLYFYFSISNFPLSILYCINVHNMLSMTFYCIFLLHPT